MAELLLLPRASLKPGRNPLPSLHFPVSKACQHPQLPFRAAPTQVHCFVPPPGPDRSHVQAGDESYGAWPAHLFTKCSSFAKPPSLHKDGAVDGTSTDREAMQDSFALGILHFIFAAGQWSQPRVKAPPPSNNFSKEEEHWITERAFRGTDSQELPLTSSKDG